MRVVVWLTPCAGFVVALLTFYPGFMSSDSLDQFEQGLNFRFSDWHPPAMALLWSLLDAIWRGPQPMLIAQLALYWTGVYFLLKAAVSEKAWRNLLIVLLLLSPAILNFLGVIWKDVQLAAAWSFASALVFAKRRHGDDLSSTAKFAILPIVLYGALVRVNAGLVAAPIALYVWSGRPWLTSVWKTVIVYACVGVFALGVGKGLNIVLDAEPTPVFDSLLAFDVAGISVETGRNFFPFSLTPQELEQEKECYGEGDTHDPFIWGACSFIWSKIVDLRSRQPSAMTKSWLSAVTRRPGEYVRHRLRYFCQFLACLTPEPTGVVWVDGIDDNKFGFVTRNGILYDILKAYVNAFSVSIVFRPIIWLLISTALLFASFYMRMQQQSARFVRTMTLQSSLYILTYLPFGVAPDFRYIYVSVIVTTFALCVVASESFRTKSAGDGRVGGAFATG
jgi:hypothetical protein